LLKKSNQIIDLNEAKLLKKRGIIEAVNDILKSVCDLERSRRRSIATVSKHG
jgi:uncharacterized protein YoxC